MKEKKKTLRPGIEPGSSAWQAEILTTILPKISYIQFYYTQGYSTSCWNQGRRFRSLPGSWFSFLFHQWQWSLSNGLGSASNGVLLCQLDCTPPHWTAGGVGTLITALMLVVTKTQNREEYLENTEQLHKSSLPRRAQQALHTHLAGTLGLAIHEILLHHCVELRSNSFAATGC